MSTMVDARGLPCPQPVLRTRDAMREHGDIITLVSGADQVGNVRRLGERAGWRVTVTPNEGAFAVHLVKGDVSAEPTLTAEMTACALPADTPSTVLVIRSEVMGRGDDELGGILVRTFFHTLSEVEPLPATIVFYNSGVKLTVEGSPVLDDLRALQEQGVEILVCGTCLGYYQLKERIAVGVISNMYTIAEMILGAPHTVTL